MVSRHHSRIYWSGGQYVVEDLGSANGVYYQEQRVSRHSFNHGDAVRCGSLWLRFVDMQGGQGQTPSGPVPQPIVPRESSQATPQYRPPTHTPMPMPQPAPPPVLPMPPMPSPVAGPPSGNTGSDPEEVKRLQRRIEQLQTELRLYRGGRGAEVAQRLEELENENDQLQSELQRIKSQVKGLEGEVVAQSTDVKAQRAERLMQQTAETVQALNDILSNLRINVMAAEGEFEQYSHEIPRASFELIREALRSSSGDVDTARTILRKLRDLAD
jgi:hypothetical protein